jgi:hypothetical protein
VPEVRLAPPPTGVIQRIGPRRHGGALSWPSLEWVRGPKHGEPPGGTNRFDDPRGASTEYTVLYAAELRITCFAETLDQFRARTHGDDPFAAAVAAVTTLLPGDPLNFDTSQTSIREPVRPRSIPEEFFASKEIGFFRITSRNQLLDIRTTSAGAMETASALSRDSAMTVRPIRQGDFAGDNRAKTQAISLWAYRRGLGGILYTSSYRLDADEAWECVALFPWTEIEQARPPIAIDRADPDLLTIATLFNLAV